VAARTRRSNAGAAAVGSGSAATTVYAAGGALHSTAASFCCTALRATSSERAGSRGVYAALPGVHGRRLAAERRLASAAAATTGLRCSHGAVHVAAARRATSIDAAGRRRRAICHGSPGPAGVRRCTSHRVAGTAVDGERWPSRTATTRRVIWDFGRAPVRLVRRTAAAWRVLQRASRTAVRAALRATTTARPGKYLQRSAERTALVPAGRAVREPTSRHGTAGRKQRRGERVHANARSDRATPHTTTAAPPGCTTRCCPGARRAANGGR
jgi:hypothetical protein